MDTCVVTEPMFKILRAQKSNIARIHTGLLLEGTTGTGEQITLYGPRPNIIRLYDTPLRHINTATFEAGWERIVTLSPVLDRSAAEIVNRNDRDFVYMVQFLVRLTDAEMATDREQQLIHGSTDRDTLAEKAHKLIADWHALFHDNINLRPYDLESNLADVDCLQGLVDDSKYDMQWAPGIEWPMAMFVAEVSGRRSAWR